MGSEIILVLFVHLFDLHLFVLSVSSSSWCFGRAAACDCGTPWTILLPFCVLCVIVCLLFLLVSLVGYSVVMAIPGHLLYCVLLLAYPSR